MKESINLHDSPIYEQNGDAKHYKQLLKKRFPIPSEIKKFVSFEIVDDEVYFVFDDDNEVSAEFADHIAFNTPETWDENEVLEFEM